MAVNSSIVRRLVEAPHAHLPMALSLGRDTLHVETLLRWLPDRRLVAAGTWGGRRVVVKLFVGARGVKESAQERRALEMLAERGVPAPACLTEVQSDDVAILVLAQLQGKLAADILAQATTRQARIELIHELSEWVRAQGERGVLQTDIHLSNFMSVAGQWFMLDAAGCRFSKVTLAGCRANLALFLAQFDPVEAGLALVSWSPETLRPTEKELLAAQRKRYRKMLAKTQRDCTEYQVIQAPGLRGMMRRDASAVVRELIEQGLGASMSQAKMLKDGRSATVVLLAQQGWVIKRYNLKGILHWCKRQFGRTRAQNSWAAGHFLGYIGIRTPRPVAYIESRMGLFTGQCWFIAEADAGTRLDEVDNVCALNAGQVAALRELFIRMWRFRCSHGDMKASNLMVGDDEVGLIDLDAWRWHDRARSARSALRRDMTRLLENWPAGSSERGCIETLFDGTWLDSGQDKERIT